MVDRLSALLRRFELHARVVHAGRLHRDTVFAAASGECQLHLLRGGTLRVAAPGGIRCTMAEPGVLLVPRPDALRIEDTSGARGSAEWVAAAVDFGVGDENPLLRALPPLLVVPLRRMPALEPALQLLFVEAQARRCGHHAVIDRLTEVLLVQLLRHAIEQRLVDGGLLAGLADARLVKTLNRIHARPEANWTLHSMASAAGMSRARFAAHFTQVVGTPPGDYLTHWRLGLARSLMRKGLSIKEVAGKVGYGSASAFGRVFTQRTGATPSQWRAGAQAGRL